MYKIIWSYHSILFTISSYRVQYPKTNNLMKYYSTLHKLEVHWIKVMGGPTRQLVTHVLTLNNVSFSPLQSHINLSLIHRLRERDITWVKNSVSNGSRIMVSEIKARARRMTAKGNARQQGRVLLQRHESRREAMIVRISAWESEGHRRVISLCSTPEGKWKEENSGFELTEEVTHFSVSMQQIN